MSPKVNPKAIANSYREFLERMQRDGEFLAIDDEVDWNLEMGAAGSLHRPAA